MISPGAIGARTRSVSPVTCTSFWLYQYSSTRRPAIGPLETFFTLLTVTMSPPTFLGAPWITSTYAVPLTGVDMRAFATVGAAAWGVAGVAFAAWANVPGAS